MTAPAGHRGPMRVLFALHALPPHEFSGSPLATDELAREFTQLGASVGVLYADPTVKAGYRYEGGEYIRLGIPPTPDTWQRWALFDQWREMAETDAAKRDSMAAVSRFAPDVVLIMDTVNLPSELPNWLLQAGIPVIRYVLHTEDVCAMIDPTCAVGDDPRCAPPLATNCVDCCVRQGLGDETTIRAAIEGRESRQRDLYAKGYARLLFPSSGFRDFFAASMPFPKERSALVTLGVDPVAPKVAPPWRLNDPITFQFLGALTLRKGALLVQEAFCRESLRSRRDYRLVFSGWGAESAIERLLRNNPNAHFTGPFTTLDMPHLLANATVGLAPTYFESFHRVTRHFLLAGVPVVGSDTFPQHDIIKHGQNGLLLPVGDADALEAAVVELLDHPETVLEMRAGARATEVRSVRACAVELLEHIADVLATTSLRTAGVSD